MEPVCAAEAGGKYQFTPFHRGCRKGSGNESQQFNREFC